MSKKGFAKNTKNKSLHSKLIAQKKKKKVTQASLRKERLNAIVSKANNQE